MTSQSVRFTQDMPGRTETIAPFLAWWLFAAQRMLSALGPQLQSFADLCLALAVLAIIAWLVAAGLRLSRSLRPVRDMCKRDALRR